VHAMKAYSGVELWSGAVAPLIILDTGWRCMVSFVHS
jgi:hypothetical protein